MQTILPILLVCSWFVQFAESQSYLRHVLARCGRNTSAQPFRGMHMYTDSAELDEQSERGISKSSAEKGTCEKRIEVNNMLENHVVYISVTGKYLHSLIRKWFSKR